MVTQSLDLSWAQSHQHDFRTVINVVPEGQHADKNRGLTARSLAGALALAARHRARHGATHHIEIVVEPGLHRVARTLEVDERIAPDVAGAGGLVIRGRKRGAHAVISGGLGLRGQSVLRDRRLLRSGRIELFPERSRKNLLSFALPPEIVKRIKSSGAIAVHRFHPIETPEAAIEVFDENRPLLPARWPNQDWGRTVSTGSTEGRAPDQLAIGRDGPDAAMPLPLEALRRQLKRRTIRKHAWIEGYPRYDWSFETYPIREIIAARGHLAFHLERTLRYESVPNARIRLAHVPALLDSPGEWVILPDLGRLVLWPRTTGTPRADGSRCGRRNARDCRIEISVTPTLLSISTAARVTLQDLTLAHSRGHGVRIDNSRNVRMDRVVVKDVAGVGIRATDSTDVSIERTVVGRSGEQGVLLAGGSRDRLTPGRLIIRQSLVVGTGRLGRTYKPAVDLRGVGNGVGKSLLCNNPHQAIAFLGNYHRILGNEITAVGWETSDSGAIYAGRDWTGRGTVIDENALHGIRAADRRVADGAAFETKGIYLDDMWSGTRIARNLFVDVDQAVFIGGGRANQVSDNTFIGVQRPKGENAPPRAIMLDARGLTWAVPSVLNVQSTINRRLRAVPTRSRIWQTAFPELALFAQAVRGAPEGNRGRGNRFVGVTPFYATPAAEPFAGAFMSAGPSPTAPKVLPVEGRSLRTLLHALRTQPGLASALGVRAQEVAAYDRAAELATALDWHPAIAHQLSDGTTCAELKF